MSDNTKNESVPVNKTNPNALENQPSGNGNAESLLHNITANKDSNAAAGDGKDAEESLASSAESIGAAKHNAAVQTKGAV